MVHHVQKAGMLDFLLNSATQALITIQLVVLIILLILDSAAMNVVEMKT